MEWIYHANDKLAVTICIGNCNDTVKVKQLFLPVLFTAYFFFCQSLQAAALSA